MSDTGPEIEYNIYAYLLCHDIRLGTYVETTVRRNRPPTKEEAETLLVPLAEALLEKQGGAACPYELRDFTVKAV